MNMDKIHIDLDLLKIIVLLYNIYYNGTKAIKNVNYVIRKYFYRLPNLLVPLIRLQFYIRIINSMYIK